MRLTILLSLLILSFTSIFPSHLLASIQNEDNEEETALVIPEPYRFKTKEVIAPAVLLGVGFAGLGWEGLKNINRDIDRELQKKSHKNIWVDEITQFLPAAAVYGLNLCGVKGMHDYVDCTIILATSYLLVGVTVYPLKDFIWSPRPDGQKFNSFPSGHTAFAFAGAEVMRREFWKTSPWIGVSGYIVAAGTAFMRLYNGAHWLTDVVAGAGFGILCAEAAYWLYPAITRALFPSRYNSTVLSSLLVAPSITSSSVSLSCSFSF